MWGPVYSFGQISFNSDVGMVCIVFLLTTNVDRVLLCAVFAKVY
jgi:hypothetical protein